MSEHKSYLTNLFDNPTSPNSSWVVIDGINYRKQTDEKGDYIVKGGTEKVYLTEYYAQQRTNAEKARVQEGITKFFSHQINDFKDWENYYASMIGKMSDEIKLFNKSIHDNSEIAYEKTRLLNPLYQKYNTDDVEKFQGRDKTNGKIWTAEKKNAKKVIGDAECRISVRRMFIESYARLMRNARFCGDTVQKLASQYLD